MSSSIRALLILVPCSGLTAQEVATKVTTHMAASASNLGQGNYRSPLVTVGRDIYTTWVDGVDGIKVAKITGRAVTTHSVPIRLNDWDDFHLGSSIAVTGTKLHLCGGMHHSPSFDSEPGGWKYWTSDGLDITKFKRDKSIPGTAVSYAKFVPAGDVLYAMWRGGVKNGFVPGGFGSQIAKYKDGRWEMLGVPYQSGARSTKGWRHRASGATTETDPRVMCWHSRGYKCPTGDASKGDGWYQGMNGTAVYRGGKLHYAVALNDGLAQGVKVNDGCGTRKCASHVIYLSTDDEGKTWKYLDGSRVTLPVGPSSRSAVSPSTRLGSTTVAGARHLEFAPAIGVCRAGPVIGLQSQQPMKQWLVVGSGSGWSAGKEFVSNFNGLLFTDLVGNIFTVHSGRLWISRNDGSRFDKLANVGPVRECLVDQQYLDKAGHVRFQSFDGPGKKMRVVTVELHRDYHYPPDADPRITPSSQRN